MDRGIPKHQIELGNVHSETLFMDLRWTPSQP
jgi:hypothetical protein